MDAIDGTNKGLAERSKFTDSSRVTTLRGSLHREMLRQEKYLLSECNVRIRLIPHDKKFYLMSAKDEYKVKITSARLELMKMRISPTVMNDHNNQLMKTNAKYPIRRSEIKTFSIAQGNMQAVKESLLVGQVPRRLIIGLLNSKAVNGNLSKNAFNF